jgi:hypothetical protein
VLAGAAIFMRKPTNMETNSKEKWINIYESCFSLLQHESVFDQMKFYNGKSTEFLENIYDIAIERKDYKTAEIIFELLKSK